MKTLLHSRATVLETNTVATFIVAKSKDLFSEIDSYEKGVIDTLMEKQQLLNNSIGKERRNQYTPVLKEANKALETQYRCVKAFVRANTLSFVEARAFAAKKVFRIFELNNKMLYRMPLYSKVNAIRILLDDLNKQIIKEYIHQLSGVEEELEELRRCNKRMDDLLYERSGTNAVKEKSTPAYLLCIDIRKQLNKEVLPLLYYKAKTSQNRYEEVVNEIRMYINDMNASIKNRLARLKDN